MIDRRGFLSMGAGVAMLGGSDSMRNGDRFPIWKPGLFQVHFIYTGVAESMFFIYPDGTALLLD